MAYTVSIEVSDDDSVIYSESNEYETYEEAEEVAKRGAEYAFGAGDDV